MKNKLTSDFEWECAPARREHGKGRVKGGIIVAVRKSLKISKIKELSNEIMEIQLGYNGNRWRIITIYSQKIEETMELLSEQIKEEEEDCLLVGGDYNARTGSEGGPIKEEKEEEKEEIRRSIDKVVNKDGRILINKIEEKGWAILNGCFGKEGGWTYIGEVGSSVIDYIVGNDRAISEVKKVEEGNRTESDHIPLEVEIDGPQTAKKSGRKTVIEIERSDWTEEGTRCYQENCKG